MNYKEKIRNLIRLYRWIGIDNKRKMKDFVRFNLGFWNNESEEYYSKGVQHTLNNDVYQKTSMYREYRRRYEKTYRQKHKASRSADVTICNYKKKYGDSWIDHYRHYLSKKERKMNYIPMVLSWCTSYKEEVQELYDLIKTNPLDVSQLKHEYKKLTGKTFYNKRD
jgi:hypothetical protein